ncbi:MAG TPA: 3-methyl-2-oxobutanoate hydroxymethyltransferase [Terriglobia bacterium]|nr:3-methyl-2-oxobutanoate hydroxymethyltransferase [Terriglobia bacterium]
MKPVRVPDLRSMKEKGEKIAMLTAYDFTMARLLDRAGIDVILVGDSLGMVVLGYETTLPVTLDMIIHHTRAVSRGAKRALIVADMPFLTFQLSIEEAMRNAGRLIQEGGAAAVKIEGGRQIIDTAKRLVDIGVPVMGHLGLTPQSVHQLGGFRPQGRDSEAAEKLMKDAEALEKAGVFGIVLESIPSDLAGRVTSSLKIPTIGIGAGTQCDGQVLVSYDALGLSDGPIPPFAKQYAQLAETILSTARAYIEDVRAGGPNR